MTVSKDALENLKIRKSTSRRILTDTLSKLLKILNLNQIISAKSTLKVARYSFSKSIPPKFERKPCRHKQRFGEINTTVVLDKDENLL